MSRGQIEVVHIRGIDVKVGDVVHARADEVLGWFVAAKVASLPNGMISITDAEEINGFLAEPLGIVGLQVMRPLTGASHPPASGSGPTSMSQQFDESVVQAEADAVEAAAVAAAEQAVEDAAAADAPKSGLFA